MQESTGVRVSICNVDRRFRTVLRWYGGFILESNGMAATDALSLSGFTPLETMPLIKSHPVGSRMITTNTHPTTPKVRLLPLQG